MEEKSPIKIYLAAPFFTEKEIRIYDLVIRYLRHLYENVFVPREHMVPDGEKMSNVDWSHKVFEIDKKGIEDCDAVVAINWGMYSDTGTAWEMGYAYALEKNVYVINVTENDPNRVFSLMTFNGCTENSTLPGFLGELTESKEDIKVTLK